MKAAKTARAREHLAGICDPDRHDDGPLAAVDQHAGAGIGGLKASVGAACALGKKADLAAFKSLPTDSSGTEITIYGRVEHDPQSNFSFLRLVGRNATTDSVGNATVTW